MVYFSIIIPTYNRATMISRAIESVLEQSFDRWELVIIDDGSQDETKTVVAQYEDLRIKYFFQENSGKSAARNRGITEAEGTFICFLDSDDYYLRYHLDILYQETQKQGLTPAVYRTGMRSIGGIKEHKSVFYDHNMGKDPILFFAKNMAGTNTLCIHQEAFEKQQFDERFHYFQDTHLLLRILIDYPLFQIPVYTCVYRVHGGRSSYTLYDQKNAKDLVENNVDAIKDLYRRPVGLAPGFLAPQFKYYMVSRKYMDHASEALIAGNITLSLLLFVKALWWDRKLWFLVRYIKYLPKVPLKVLMGYPNRRW